MASLNLRKEYVNGEKFKTPILCLIKCCTFWCMESPRMS